MTPDDQYPSTFDCKPILGAQDDAVLECMKGAMHRVEVGHSVSSYIGYSGTVCAIGGVLAEDGLIYDDIVGEGNGAWLLQAIDNQLSNEAKEAIALLNAAALRRHPEAEDYGNWSGPLEWVNQEWLVDAYGETSEDDDDLETIKAEILAIYQDAIDERSGAAVR